MKVLDISFTRQWLPALFLAPWTLMANPSSTHGLLARHYDPKRAVHRGPPTKRDGSIPLNIENRCVEDLWPGIGTQAGTGPGEGGFLLKAGDKRSLLVSDDWQGRVWGRTNCSFNMEGTRASNLNGHDGGGAACITGDCGGVLDCVMTGQTPVTLFEIDLAGGSSGTQTFYDISLVDGYNLPMGVVHLPAGRGADIPPNLTNCACIATAGLLLPPASSGDSGNSSNSNYPIPYEPSQSSRDIASWCPWNLQQTPPKKPGDGVYPYPDDNIQRPIFSPCLSGCSKTNSPSDCCTGSYNDPNKCSPNLYAKSAKQVCPDAYSYAFDDQTSTFIVPNGGGWQVTFCPAGRSTNILRTLGPEMQKLASGTKMLKAVLEVVGNRTLVRDLAVRNVAASEVIWRGWWGIWLLVVTMVM